LCQYEDQLNSLAGLSHKNKLSYATSQNTGSYIRDIQEWYLGRICPIESPRRGKA
ncbi:MAG: hypothetical protein ACKESA_00150, partial [Candidatus Hodgkinia cicadicola]